MADVTKKGKILNITEDRARAALAKATCSETQMVILELFPELNYVSNFETGQLFFAHDEDGSDVGNIYILAHLQNGQEYTLINLSNGYWRRRGVVYTRKQGVGILIPASDLAGLQPFSIDSIKEKMTGHVHYRSQRRFHTTRRPGKP